jgi:GPI mannosyltransferase 2
MMQLPPNRKNLASPPPRPMAMPSPLAGVVRLAAASRLVVILLSVLFRLLFLPYDTSALLHPPCLSPSSSPSSNLSAAVSSLAVWDGVHFARVAECGYEYEQSFAFLPLLPASLALLARSRKHLLVTVQMSSCTRLI